MGIGKDIISEVAPIAALGAVAWAVIKYWDKINPFNSSAGAGDNTAAYGGASYTRNPDGSATYTSPDGTTFVFGGTDINPVPLPEVIVDHTGEPGWQIIGVNSQGYPIWQYSNPDYKSPELKSSPAAQPGYTGTGTKSDPYVSKNSTLKGTEVSRTSTSAGDIIVSSVSPAKSSSSSSSSLKKSSSSELPTWTNPSTGKLYQGSSEGIARIKAEQGY